MMSGIEKAVEVAADLQANFWENWKEIVRDFPDIEDSDSVKLVAIQAALTGLVGSYLLGYEKQNRKIYLELFISGLRLIERQLKDEE